MPKDTDNIVKDTPTHQKDEGIKTGPQRPNILQMAELFISNDTCKKSH